MSSPGSDSDEVTVVLISKSPNNSQRYNNGYQKRSQSPASSTSATRKRTSTALDWQQDHERPRKHAKLQANGSSSHSSASHIEWLGLTSASGTPSPAQLSSQPDDHAFILPPCASPRRPAGADLEDQFGVFMTEHPHQHSDSTVPFSQGLSQGSRPLLPQPDLQPSQAGDPTITPDEQPEPSTMAIHSNSSKACVDLCTSDEEEEDPLPPPVTVKQEAPLDEIHLKSSPSGSASLSPKAQVIKTDSASPLLHLPLHNSPSPSDLQQEQHADHPPSLLSRRRLPFLKRLLEPAIVHRPWGGKEQELHRNLAIHHRITASLLKLEGPYRFPRSSNNPSIKYLFGRTCVEHQQIEPEARARTWLYDDACAWCDGSERPIVPITNMPDLLTHLRDAHPSFTFKARRYIEDGLVRITVQCQHPDIPLPTPQASTSSSASIVPSNALVVRSSASPHRRDADDTIHDLGDATFCDQPHAPDALANLTFMALALSHAEREKNSKASTIPKSVKMQGMRYKPQPQPGWSGAKKERKHVAQTFHVSKRPYVRSRDFGAYNPLEVCSDSEDDDGDNYHWESHHHQTKLADQPDVDPKVVFMQQLWTNISRSMGDAARSRPYEACLRLVVSNFAQIAARAARKELVEHLAAMASWQTITADQAESLVNKYDRRVEDSSHNQQQQGALVLSRPELSRKRT